MLDFGILIVLEAALLAAVIVLREPKLLIPAVILGLPFEYANTQYLTSWGDSGLHGVARAFLNPGKMAMLATIVVGAVRVRQDPGRLFPNSRIMLPIVVMLAVMIAGLGWADSQRPTSLVVVMAMYVAFVFVAPSLIEDRRDIERIIGAFLIAAAVMGAIAVAQRWLGVFTWRDYLFSEGAYRSNATFSDPNILARYLIVSITLAAGLVLTTGPRRTTVYLAIPALGLGLLGMVATGSRSGLGVLVICTFFMVLISPIQRGTKLKLIGVAGCALLLGLAFILARGGANADRLTSLTNPTGALGQRTYLIKGGWEMFLDHPLTGVGTGSYQHELLTGYRHVIPWWGFDVSLSHTSLITIAAEEGLIGLLALGFAIVRITLSSARTYFGTKDHFTRLISGWLGVALLGIFLESQSEGRLLDEPYLYVLLAILAAIEMRVALTRVAATEPVRETAAARVKVESMSRQPAPGPAPATDLASEKH